MRWLVLLLMLCGSVAFAQDPNEDPTESGYISGAGVAPGDIDMSGNALDLNAGKISDTSDGIVTIDSGDDLECSLELHLADTTTSTAGVITKGASRFLHNFHHPTGNGALPAGVNLFLGEDAGNFTFGSTATQTYQASYNIGIGGTTLENLTTGYGNTAIGQAALNDVTTASYNFGLGFVAGAKLNTGSNNVAIGPYALTKGTTSSGNIAIGRYSLPEVVAGSLYNVAIGQDAGYKVAGGASNNTTSTSSIFIGYQSRPSATSESNQIVIGDTTDGNGSNTVTIGNDTVDATHLQGTVIIQAESDKGAATNHRTKTESVTFNADPGEASKATIGSIIPAGAFVVGVSGRVTTANTGGCTSIDIGIAAKDTDAFADGIAVAATTTFTVSDGNAAGVDYSAASLGLLPSVGAQEITVTAVGGDGKCDDMVVALTVHYIDITAATSN